MMPLRNDAESLLVWFAQFRRGHADMWSFVMYHAGPNQVDVVALGEVGKEVAAQLVNGKSAQEAKDFANTKL